MKKASAWFGEEDRAAVAKAVTEAEKTTAGEIVPVVATSSENYERAEGLGGITLALASLAVGWVLAQRVEPSEWSSTWEPTLGLVECLLLVAGGYLVGSAAVRFIPAAKRLLTGKRRMAAEVAREAADSFMRYHVRGTKAATGVVIYVSLFEHLVTVLGDRAIAEKVGASEWQAIADVVAREMRERHPKEALLKGIAQVGALLSKHFPRAADDKDELSNDLVLVD